jgi:hypothetical protein
MPGTVTSKNIQSDSESMHLEKIIGPREAMLIHQSQEWQPNDISSDMQLKTWVCSCEVSILDDYSESIM